MSVLRSALALATPAQLLWLLSCALGVLGAATAEGQTGQPQISFGNLGATTVQMTITWTLAPGATQHVVDGSYNDGSAKFTVTSPTSPVIRPMPYHSSGAATGGWVCVTGTVNNATIPQACNGYTVPAKPVTPPASTEVFITFLEPSLDGDGTPLKDLGTIRAYWRIDGGPESMVLLPASGPTGGLKMTHSLMIPAAAGTLTVQVSSVDLSGNESLQRSNTATKPLGPPAKGTIRVNTITQ